MQGKGIRVLGLCASTCTLRVCWLLKRRPHPGVRQTNRGRTAVSCSLEVGEWSLPFLELDSDADGEDGGKEFKVRLLASKRTSLPRGEMDEGKGD